MPEDVECPLKSVSRGIYDLELGPALKLSCSQKRGQADPQPGLDTTQYGLRAVHNRCDGEILQAKPHSLETRFHSRPGARTAFPDNPGPGPQRFLVRALPGVGKVADPQ